MISVNRGFTAGQRSSELKTFEKNQRAPRVRSGSGLEIIITAAMLNVYKMAGIRFSESVLKWRRDRGQASISFIEAWPTI